MGIWQGIKSIFTGSPDKVLDMASGVGNFIDETFYTDEEKSNAKLKLFELKLKWLNATQGQNLARRYCAIMFGLNFIFTFQVAFISFVVGWWLGIDTKTLTIGIIDIVTAFQLGWIMIAIISFYFGKEMIKPK